jgi:hypothetical protein
MPQDAQSMLCCLDDSKHSQPALYFIHLRKVFSFLTIVTAFLSDIPAICPYLQTSLPLPSVIDT